MSEDAQKILKEHMSENQLFLKPKELAEILNVTLECIRGWIYQKRIPIRRFGGAVRISKEIAEKMIDGELPAPSPIQRLRKQMETDPEVKEKLDVFIKDVLGDEGDSI